ncbi:MAG TPA: DUF2934 domain-containing protein [Verrucomicrobiae bacterium]|jgi:hypothetical protein
MKTKNKRSSTAKLLTSGANGRLSHEDIAFAAYCLWEHEGRPQGHDWNYWFRAEDLLRRATHRAHVPA